MQRHVELLLASFQHMPEPLHRKVLHMTYVNLLKAASRLVTDDALVKMIDEVLKDSKNVRGCVIALQMLTW